MTFSASAGPWMTAFASVVSTAAVHLVGARSFVDREWHGADRERAGEHLEEARAAREHERDPVAGGDPLGAEPRGDVVGAPHHLGEGATLGADDHRGAVRVLRRDAQPTRRAGPGVTIEAP